MSPAGTYQLRDLVERLDRALDVVQFADFSDDDDTAVIERDYLEGTLEAAAAFLHELHLRVTAP